MAYRTKTYIAADWTGDKDAVEQLHKWNDSDHWSLSFIDAHDLTQARDESLNCSIVHSELGSTLQRLLFLLLVKIQRLLEVEDANTVIVITVGQEVVRVGILWIIVAT